MSSEQFNTSEGPLQPHSKTGMRLLYTILFLMIAHVLAGVLALLVVFQFGYAAITQQPPHGRVTRLARRILRYGLEIGNYITWNTDQPPFPFEELPNGAESRNTYSAMPQ